jgi:catechol 2,3-dioxygenase-like lactoylglutathione lyase family enzyme
MLSFNNCLDVSLITTKKPTGRALHWVFKVANRQESIDFYTKVLGMQVLRHDEIEQEVSSDSDSPYDNRWSKTVVGFDHEDTHFVAELHYHYCVGSYKMGNDFRGMTIESDTALENIRRLGYPVLSEKADGSVEIAAPGGYKFIVCKGDNKVSKISLAVSNLQRSIEFWRNLLGMNVYSQGSTRTLFGYASDQCKVELIQIQEPIEHEKAYGRIAFSCPWDDQAKIRKAVKEANGTILSDLIELTTPGKPTVRVVILADPDGYEICFVGDEAYRLLSQIDPKADELLMKVCIASISHLLFE